MEVELVLMPGLPQMQITGLPDAAIRESQWRIKSALRAKNFSWPKAQKILVNLRPSHLRKTSPGLDLAIAAAYLCETGQIQIQEMKDKLYFYGELGLDGEIHSLPELALIEEVPGVLITGQMKEGLSTDAWVAKDLNQIDNLQPVYAKDWSEQFERPYFDEFLYSKNVARTLEIAATGHHSIFVAGPAGTGKTTFAQALHSLMKYPSLQEQKSMRAAAHLFGEKLQWRPHIAPHHTSPTKTLIGGTGQSLPGEITRAHGGMLFLDEFLEFKGEVIEALREPIEKAEISVARLQSRTTYPADFQLVAASNLCPCGEFYPKSPKDCERAIYKCKGYLQRLSGPLLDRFQMVTLSHQWKKQKMVEWEFIKNRVEKAHEFIESRGQRITNSRLKPRTLNEQINDFDRKNLMPETGDSIRRREALVRVARSIADLEGSEVVRANHLQEASHYALGPLSELRWAHS